MRRGRKANPASELRSLARAGLGRGYCKLINAMRWQHIRKTAWPVKMDALQTYCATDLNKHCMWIGLGTGKTNPAVARANGCEA